MGMGGKIPNNAVFKRTQKNCPGTYSNISLDLVPGKVTEQDLYKTKSRQLSMGRN